MSAKLVGLVLLACLAGGENRLWYVDLELRGPCAEVRLDCGSDGETRLLGPFASGEDRRASVPVPVRSPLGAAGLRALPLPRVLVLPAGAGGTAAVLGWSEAQPAAGLERNSAALLARARPPLAAALPRAAWPEIVLVLIAGAFLLRARRRLALAVLLALGAGGAALALARSRQVAARTERILEWEAGGTLALSVTLARDEIALLGEGLEVVPAGARLEFRLENSGPGRARAAGAELVVLASAGIPPLAAERNGAEALAAVWTRSPAGEWNAHGPWESGGPLGARVAEPGDPPGWLLSGLPPGRGVLLGRTAAGAWLRCLGFESE